MEAVREKSQSRWDWTKMIGLGECKADLSRVLGSGRLHPVILFEGLEGIGKRHLSIWLAAMMLCRNSSRAEEPCGKCGICSEIMQGVHPDVVVLDPEGESIKTSDVERLQDHFSMMSPDGLRIGIIMNAERMTTEACNRALKTLEEPSEQTRIILTSSRPLLLPPTVLGRCLRWRVKPPSKVAVIAWFRNLLSAAGRSNETDESIVRWASRLRFSPGLLKREIEDGSDHLSGIHGDVTQLLHATTAIEVSKAASNLARLHKAKVPEILAAIEWELNRSYRDRLCLGRSSVGHGVENLRRLSQRRMLRDLRRQAVFGKVTLNAQLVAESIGLCGWGAD